MKQADSQTSPLKTMPFILFALAALMLAGCNGTTVVASVAAAGIFLTKPDEPPPADTASQIAAHESWCYETLGDIECHAKPVREASNRLVMVEPQNRYPLTTRAYHEAVVEAQ
ncbi:MAG: hypothetical protein WAO98_10125 [Alphaproteobacteria bacterium]